MDRYQVAASRPYIRRTLNVTITYDTSSQKINEAIDILQEILAAAAHSTGGTEYPGLRQSSLHSHCLALNLRCLQRHDPTGDPRLPPRSIERKFLVRTTSDTIPSAIPLFCL
jgi:hypothetical protein